MTKQTQRNLKQTFKQTLKKGKQLNIELEKCSLKKCPNSLTEKQQKDIFAKCKRNYKCFSKTHKKLLPQINERLACITKHCKSVKSKILKNAIKLGNISTKLMKH